MEITVKEFFRRYEAIFNQALADDVNMEDVAALYASEFIAASPAGVMTGKNDGQLKEVMAQGYERYRAIGTKSMQIRDIRLSAINDRHCMAHVAWQATYDRTGKPDEIIDFDVHYLVQIIEEMPKVFGWISGDEQALLRERGII